MYKASVKTKTWLLSIHMDTEEIIMGNFGELIGVSDDRLLYEKSENSDLGEYTLCVHNFEHDMLYEISIPPYTRPALLKPSTHEVALMITQYAGQYLHVYDQHGMVKTLKSIYIQFHMNLHYYNLVKILVL